MHGQPKASETPTLEQGSDQVERDLIKMLTVVSEATIELQRRVARLERRIRRISKRRRAVI